MSSGIQLDAGRRLVARSRRGAKVRVVLRAGRAQIVRTVLLRGR